MPGQRHVPSTLGWRSHKSLQAEALLAALLVFCVGLLYLKAQSLRHTQSQTARVIQPQTPASSVCTGTVAGEWRPTQSTDGRLTISVHGDSARGVYLFERRRRTLTGKVTPAGLSGTWSEESTAVAPGDAGEFDAKFDPARHTLELFFLVGGDLGGRSTWSCTPDNSQPIPSTPTATATPFNFTLEADKTKTYQGESVTFKLNPLPPPGYPYLFVLHFKENEKDVAIDYLPDRPSTYRFLTAGQHEVSVSVRSQSPQLSARISSPKPMVSNHVMIDVAKIEVAVAPRPGESGPPFVVNQEISFSIPDLHDPSVKYQYVFDDKKAKEAGPTITNHFTTAVKHTVYVNLIFRSNDTLQTVKSDPQDVLIDLLPSDAVSFSADPPTQIVNKPVNFAAVLDPNRLNALRLNSQKLQYRFTYGDGEIRDWDASPNAVYEYRQARNFEPYVEIRLDDGRAGTLLVKSAVFPVTISAAPFRIDPKIILIVGAVIVLIGATLLLYFSMKFLRRPIHVETQAPTEPAIGDPVHAPSTRPTIVFYTDEKSPPLKLPQVSVNLQVRFTSGGHQDGALSSSPGAGLVRFVRRRNV